jgi:hypothetical protein
VRGELFSIVVSDCFDAVGERQKHPRAGLYDRVRALVRQLGELGVFGFSLDMRHDSASVPGTDNCVGLPVSDAAFCGDNGRSLIDVDAVRNQPAPRILAFPLVVFFAAVTQVKMQCAAVFFVFPDMLTAHNSTHKAADRSKYLIEKARVTAFRARELRHERPCEQHARAEQQLAVGRFMKRTLKYEEVYLRGYDSVSEAQQSIGRYLDFYNARSPHSALDRRTPDQAYFDPLPLRAAA